MPDLHNDVHLNNKAQLSIRFQRKNLIVEIEDSNMHTIYESLRAIRTNSEEPRGYGINRKGLAKVELDFRKLSSENINKAIDLFNSYSSLRR